MFADAAHDVIQSQLRGGRQASRLKHFLNRLQRLTVKISHAISFAGHHQSHLTFGILRGHPCGAIAGMTGLSLNAAQGKHKASGTVAPICAQSQGSHDIEPTDDFAAGTQTNLLSQFQADQGVVNQAQAF